MGAFLSVYLVIEFYNIKRITELFGLAVIALASDLDAVVHHADKHACLTVDAKVFRQGYSVGCPVERVSRTDLYAGFTLDANTGVLVYGYTTFRIQVLDFSCRKKLLTLRTGNRLVRRLLYATGKEIKYVYRRGLSLRHGEMDRYLKGDVFGYWFHEVK